MDGEDFGEMSGVSQDHPFTLNMCRVRCFRCSSRSLPESILTNEIWKEVKKERLDPENVLCTAREDYTGALSLTEDDFDDV
ncbi:unnamed protein product [Cercopithifilaria johnstoni]|uniref:Uncharacterized protein n=1 Tax=Cercopithifilaria johnstoni TaxID=2874296 RepID=A0A8J2MGH9_9BILA|nr:unnamed protein product [Cercopithifilaria johnstoni]